ncbi:MAG: helix-turn-helix domain-containing protein [Fimbriiglobus sp.]
MPTTPISSRRLAPADLPPELRERYQGLRAAANADIAAGRLGPPAQVGALEIQLRTCVGQLKAARKAAGLTLADLSDRTGVAVEILSLFEAGDTNPHVQPLGLYAAAVGRRIVLDTE